MASNKMPIEWHKNCLMNMRKSSLRLQDELKKMEERQEKLWNEIAFYSRQIAAAEKAGKSGFDRGRYLLSGRKEKI